MRRILLPAILIVLLGAGCRPLFQAKPKPVSCTMEAKLCTDGSSVGRTGPNCEFAACPEPLPPAPTSTPPSMCPQIAKACPDGSFVHPQGPNCEIPACPKAQSLDSGIQGSLMLGPVCPVETVPPDPNCAPKPYHASVTIQAKTQDGSRLVTTFTTDAQGNFKVALNPGTYLLVPMPETSYPRGSQRQVTVQAHAYTQADIAFDTGIR